MQPYTGFYKNYYHSTRTQWIKPRLWRHASMLIRCMELVTIISWRRHQMETFSALLAICAGNSPVPGEFPTQRPVTRSFDVFFDLRLNKRLSKQLWGWWFETLSCPLSRHHNVHAQAWRFNQLGWGSRSNRLAKRPKYKFGNTAHYQGRARFFFLAASARESYKE